MVTQLAICFLFLMHLLLLLRRVYLESFILRQPICDLVLLLLFLLSLCDALGFRLPSDCRGLHQMAADSFGHYSEED